MLSISKPKKNSTRKLTPNILPCHIHHSGPIAITSTHWRPTAAITTSAQSKKPVSTAYFRGRKLLGRRMRVPEHYTGYLLQKTDKLVPQKVTGSPHAHISFDGLEGVEMGLEDGEEKEVDVKVMDCLAGFDEIVVWGHDQVPDEDDEYGRGVDEWIAFAEAVGHHIKPG